MATYPPQAGRTISASPRAASNSGDPHTDDDRLDNASPRQGKIRKVSRACDFCKARKARCSGDVPCQKCLAKRRTCLYSAKYTRGRPPTPPPSTRARSSVDHDGEPPAPWRAASMDLSRHAPQADQDSAAPSRASPELGPSEIQGQVFDPTSGFSFLHRAWKRLSSRNAGSIQGDSRTVSSDKPLAERREHAPLQLPDPSESRRLLALYFDVCIATYRVLHHPTVEEWLTIVERNVNQGQPAWHRLGRSRAAVVLAVLAIAATHHEKSKGISSQEDESRALSLSDELFGVSLRLVDVETGPPRLESAQARLVQVLYLLTTSRFNRAWFVFGSALQLISALGLHRRANTKKRKVTREDYVQTQCGLRLFWSAYILDNYLGVVFGRPRHYNDDDIDQVFPDRINDEDMTSIGPEEGLDHLGDCHIDALIFHAKIGKIIGCISREVYTIKDVPEGDRVAAAHRLIQEVDQWRSSLPAYLGSVPPRMLILSYRRQATVLKIAHSHAVMHASRLFLLGDPSLHKNHVRDCVAAARTVLETVDGMAKEGPIFHAFWWTHYVTFCALVVVYIWEIQQRRAGAAAYQSRTSLLNMAERCHTHLAQATATNSPSRRYAVILEEFRRTALGRSISEEGGDDPDAAEQPGAFTSHQRQQLMDGGQAPDAMESGIESMGSLANFDPQQFDGWQMTDFFLDLDSSAFWPHVDVDESMLWSSMGF